MNMFLSRKLRKRSFGILLVCVAGCAGLIFSAPAHAATCTISSAVINFGAVTVPSNTPVGTPFGPVQQWTGTWSCQSNPITPPQTQPAGFFLFAHPQSPSSAGAWNTNSAGIGVKVFDLTYTSTGDNHYGVLSLTQTGNWAPFVAYEATSFVPNTSTATSSGSFTLTFQLVKTTANVTAGGASSKLVANLSSNDLKTGIQTVRGTLTVQIASVTNGICSVAMASQSKNVALPDVKASTFSTVGATAGNTPFSIDLTCPAGLNSNVYITLTDATNPGNTTSNLTLSSESTATGVKLRLLKSGGAPVSYGPESAVAGNQNQWLVGASGSTTNIPLSVQYISTGTVGPGIVKGKATFTMSYQ